MPDWIVESSSAVLADARLAPHHQDPAASARTSHEQPVQGPALLPAAPGGVTRPPLGGSPVIAEPAPRRSHTPGRTTPGSPDAGQESYRREPARPRWTVTAWATRRRWRCAGRHRAGPPAPREPEPATYS